MGFMDWEGEANKVRPKRDTRLKWQKDHTGEVKLHYRNVTESLKTLAIMEDKKLEIYRATKQILVDHLELTTGGAKTHVEQLKCQQIVLRLTTQFAECLDPEDVVAQGVCRLALLQLVTRVLSNERRNNRDREKRRQDKIARQEKIETREVTPNDASSEVGIMTSPQQAGNTMVDERLIHLAAFENPSFPPSMCTVSDILYPPQNSSGKRGVLWKAWKELLENDTSYPGDFDINCAVRKRTVLIPDDCRLTVALLTYEADGMREINFVLTPSGSQDGEF